MYSSLRHNIGISTSILVPDKVLFEITHTSLCMLYEIAASTETPVVAVLLVNLAQVL